MRNIGISIKTETVPPNEDRDWRIKATDRNGNKIIIPFPFPKGAKKKESRKKNYLYTETAHMRAAKALCRKMGWTGKIVGSKEGKGRYGFILMPIKGTRNELLPKLSYTRPYARNPNSKEEIRWL